MNPLHVTFLWLAATGFVLFLIGVLLTREQRRKSVLTIKRKEKVSWLDSLLNRVPYIVKREERLNKRLSILSLNMSARAFTKYKVLAAVLACFVGALMHNALVVPPLIIIFISIPEAVIDNRISKRVSQMEEQTLEAFQLFLTEYTTTRNILQTLVNISPKLEYPLRSEFELLARNLHSGVPYEESLRIFAERTDNKWTNVFAQMMITYIREGGDFTPHLLNITRYITDEKILSEENKTEMSSVRTVNLLLNALIPVAYVMNTVMNPEGVRVFITTSTGKFMILIVSLCVLASLYLSRKISEA